MNVFMYAPLWTRLLLQRDQIATTFNNYISFLLRLSLLVKRGGGSIVDPARRYTESLEGPDTC